MALVCIARIDAGVLCRQLCRIEDEIRRINPGVKYVDLETDVGQGLHPHRYKRTIDDVDFAEADVPAPAAEAPPQPSQKGDAVANIR